ncbi:unnamed protein product [Urochloa humidicola]
MELLFLPRRRTRELQAECLTISRVRTLIWWEVPTIDQDTGIPGPTEPTETLQTYRSGEVLLPGNKNKLQVLQAYSNHLEKLMYVSASHEP